MFAPTASLLVFLSIFFNVDVQQDDHIRWKFSSIRKSSTETTLMFTATLDKGWHLYSQNLKEDGPKPTTFGFSNNENVKLLGKVKERGDAKTVYDSTFMMNVVWYENEVVFTQRVKVKSDVKVTGEINYSVCSEERCIPGSARFSIDVGR